MGNTFGKILCLTTFGESHGKAIGGILDGFPAGIKLDIDFINSELEKRKPGQSIISSTRKEEDKIEILSGVYEGYSTGAPIGFIIYNKDIKSKDYSHLKDIFRPSHADYTYLKKYGIRDYRGGGRSSARETANWVAAGAFAKLFLKKYNIKINAFVSQIANYKLEIDLKKSGVYNNINFENIYKNIVRCPNNELAEKMINLIKKVKKEGDSIGGRVTCIVRNLFPGLGEPVFDKLDANLAKAMLSINAAKGFEIGSGFSAIKMKGSEHNDIFFNDNGEIRTYSNYSGGIQGGISNGEDIVFNVAFKPTPTIMKEQYTVNLKGEKVKFRGKGRHDPCIVPRAVSVVEALTALVIADSILCYNSKN